MGLKAYQTLMSSSPALLKRAIPEARLVVVTLLKCPPCLTGNQWEGEPLLVQGDGRQVLGHKGMMDSCVCQPQLCSKGRAPPSDGCGPMQR